MAIVVECCVLLALGLAITVRFGGRDLKRPAIDGPLKNYVWTVALATWTTLFTAILVVGPCARLAMRILAVTAGDAVQGRKTEADEIVGRISGGGTISIFIFIGLFFAFGCVIAFVFLRQWLPHGRVGGLTLGAVLLITAGATVDPVRSNNPDFDLVGPGYLAIAIFVVMALLAGMATFAIADWVSTWLPPIAWSVRGVVPYASLAFLGVAFFLLPAVILGGIIAVVVDRTKLKTWLRSRRVTLAGRLAIGAVTAASIPTFASAVVDIAGRGP